MIAIETLRSIPLFAGMTDEQLIWLADAIQLVEVEPGEVLLREGDERGDFFVVLRGEVQVFKNAYGGDQVVLATAGEGGFMGEMSLLTGSPHSASVRATMPSVLVRVEPAVFSSMITTCSSVAAILLRTLAERTKANEALMRQGEKMAALGTLSAGLAHQLNNPASAAARAASQMRRSLIQVNGLSIKFLYQHLNDDLVDYIAAFQRRVVDQASQTRYLPPLVQSDLEEQMIGWLESHGVEDGWRLAPTFVAAGLTVEQLEDAASRFDEGLLCDILMWVEGTLAAVGLLTSVEQSTLRVAELVQAVKAYSFMDQAPLQDVNVHEGIDNSIIILGHKLGDHVRIIRHYDPDLPRILAYGSELNQVWTNIIDNAVDAVEGKGEIRITTWREAEGIVVEIADNGTGIAPEIQSRIFEPFFTTKPQDRGMGLGLDIVYRVVKGHKGDIRVTSQPGDTRFQVRLPLRFSTAS
jgi:signal transduction histidine kinase